MNGNEREALKWIRRGVVQSRSDLARELGISRPTASVIVDSLLACGAIEEKGARATRCGKSPILLGVRPGEQVFLGVDLGYAAKIAGVVVDGTGSVLQRCELENGSDLRQIVAQILAMVERLGAHRQVAGLGLAVSGIVDRETDVVLRSVNPLFLGDALKRCVAPRFPFPVRLCNRSRSATFSEAFGGAGDRDGSFALISLGRSIGASFWVDGALFEGRHGGSGEIRNLRLRSGETFEEALSPERCKTLDDDQLLAFCADGLEQMMDLMDLDLLVLSGRFADFSPDFPRLLEERLRFSRQCTVRMASFGRYSAARGVAFRMLEEAEA